MLPYLILCLVSSSTAYKVRYQHAHEHWDPWVLFTPLVELSNPPPDTAEHHPRQVTPQTDFSLPSCSDFSHLGYECVQEFRCIKGEIRNVSSNARSSRTSSRSQPSNGKFSPWTKTCPDNSHVCCKNPNLFKMQGTSSSSSSSFCPFYFSGPQLYPPDCGKYVDCWKGRPTLQNCDHGSHYNAERGQCDTTQKAGCYSSSFFSFAQDQTGRSSSSSSMLRVFPSPPSGQRLRLRGGRGPFWGGYLEMFRGGKWGFVCDEGGWTQKEADVVCRQLGFRRGARVPTLATQAGWQEVDENLQVQPMTENVECKGTEQSFDQCSIAYAPSSGSSCALSKSFVSITCISDSSAACEDEDVPWGDSCYSIQLNRSSFLEAKHSCNQLGMNLAEVSTQEENDALSEMLLWNANHSGLLLSEAWIAGAGAGSKARMPISNLISSRGSFIKWWPGWNNERRNRISLFGSLPMATKLSRAFVYNKFVVNKDDGVKEKRLTDYFFWTLEDIQQRLPFICERRQKNIGCLVGKGQDYRGNASMTAKGKMCLLWDPDVVDLSRLVGEENIPNLGPLEGNHFCRNPDGDSAPWCLVHPDQEFDFCDIPQCGGSYSSSPTGIDISSRCGEGFFHCGSDKCIPNILVCDDEPDCPNERDEDGCNGKELFRKMEGYELKLQPRERWKEHTIKACAVRCRSTKGFLCRSFNYHKKFRVCTLSESNVGLSGRVEDADYDLYELISEMKSCDAEFTCPDRKCLRKAELCDGKNDCGDRFDQGSLSNYIGFDERNCLIQPNLKIRLVNGTSKNEGRVEVKAFDFPYGGICDDGFKMPEADVVCKQAGFPMGAKKALLHSHFGSGNGPILMDELDCDGTEESLLDCKFNPWNETDCSSDEWAGVVCKQESRECKGDEHEDFRCGSGECIPLDLLCNGHNDCQDGSDELNERCKAPLKVRLAEGDEKTFGRVEVMHNGVWGTVCADNFGEAEGAVVCRMHGLGDCKAKVFKGYKFGAGSGPIWIRNISCKGDEKSLADCNLNERTTECRHEDDLGIECVPYPDGTNAGTFVGTTGCKLMCNDADNPPSSADIITPDEHHSASLVVSSTEDRPRVAGGPSAEPGSNPWAASIHLDGEHHCGAVIMSEFNVLTAAHCFSPEKPMNPRSRYTVRVGDHHNKNLDPDERELDVDLKALHHHPQYNHVSYNNDITLVRVRRNSIDGRGIIFGPSVQPACLPEATASYARNEDCWAAGWGKTGTHEPLSTVLKVAQLPILDPGDCIASHIHGQKITAGMFCAGYLSGGVDTCQGDSGGGLVCGPRNKPILMGLVSWGNVECGKKDKPGVYTKVARYLDWLESKVTC